MQVFNNIEQRSPEWYNIRAGKITASPIVKILGKDGLAKTAAAIDNLAMELAIESVHGIMESDYVSFDMQRGIDSEPSALFALESYLQKEFIELHKLGFVMLSEHIGASPDGITSNNYNVEAKCPSPENYFKGILSNTINPVYYAQMQHQMMCGDTEATYFINYCFHNNKEFTTIKVIERDNNMIDLIKSRCEIVIEKKLKYIGVLKSNIDKEPATI